MLLKLPFIVIWVMLAALGLLQTLVFWRFTRTFSRWPTVRAEITHSRLLNQLIDGKNAVEAIIAFKYEIGGREYVSKTPVLRGYNLFPNLKFESRLVRQYRPGDIVLARFHPLSPSVAYLEKAPISWSSTILLPAWIALGIGVVYAFEAGYFAELWDCLVLQNDLLLMESEARRQ